LCVCLVECGGCCMARMGWFGVWFLVASVCCMVVEFWCVLWLYCFMCDTVV